MMDQCFQLQMRRFFGFRFVPVEFDLPLFSFQFGKFQTRRYEFCRRSLEPIEVSSLIQNNGNRREPKSSTQPQSRAV